MPIEFLDIGSSAYTKMSSKEKKEYKIELERKIMEDFNKNIKGIINRKLKLKSIGKYKMPGLNRFLNEARKSYEIGNFASSISTAAFTAELISIDKVRNIKPKLSASKHEKILILNGIKKMNQAYRIKWMLYFGIISDMVYKKFLLIKEKRNDLLHHKIKPKNLENTSRQSIDALSEIIKDIYGIG